jgi:hypothetical protein
VFWFSLSNLSLAQEPLQNPGNFKTIRNQIRENYTSDQLLHKNDFININGLYARITGRQELNDVYRTKNGMLTETIPTYKSNDMHRSEVLDFVECVAKGERNRNDVKYAVGTSKILQAIYDSSEAHAEIKID